jgi:hypothetical protein
MEEVYRSARAWRGGSCRRPDVLPQVLVESAAPSGRVSGLCRRRDPRSIEVSIIHACQQGRTLLRQISAVCMRRCQALHNGRDLPGRNLRLARDRQCVAFRVGQRLNPTCGPDALSRTAGTSAMSCELAGTPFSVQPLMEILNLRGKFENALSPDNRRLSDLTMGVALTTSCRFRPASVQPMTPRTLSIPVCRWSRPAACKRRKISGTCSIRNHRSWICWRVVMSISSRPKSRVIAHDVG